MMDLENTWQQGDGSDDALNKMLQQKKLSNLPSKSPLQKLKTNLSMSLIAAALITAFYVYLLFIIDTWQVNVALGILILFNTWIGVDSWKLYKNINVNISATNSLKDELQRNYTSFQRWWRIQEKLGLFVYPIGVGGGFILGGVEGSGKTVEAFLYHPKMLLILAVIVVIVVPLCYLMARWMFNLAYGKHLKKLKATIDELNYNL